MLLHAEFKASLGYKIFLSIKAGTNEEARDITRIPKHLYSGNTGLLKIQNRESESQGSKFHIRKVNQEIISAARYLKRAQAVY